MSGAARVARGAAWSGHRFAGLAWLALVGCGGTDIVARERVACSALDGGCDDGGEPTDADDANATSDASDSSAPLGCSARSCGALNSYTAVCSGSGAVVQAGDSCTADAGPTSARHALCTCTDLVSNSTLQIDAFQGTLQTPAPNAATVGVNRELALSGSGSIDGEVRVVGRRAVGPNMRLDALVPVSAPPCRCEAEAWLDIEALVRAHQTDNDNAREALSEDELDGFAGAKELTLPCGRYYFTRLKSESALTLRTRGNVVIFVENDIELNDALSIQTDPDAAGQVNVFVAGNARVRGALALGGDPNGRARVNLYVHGIGTLELGGSAEIVGQLYAPRAELVNAGNLQLWGSLFVDRAALSADTFIHYDISLATPARCDGM